MTARKVGIQIDFRKVENAAYSGLCAERTALVKAITSGTSSRQFKAIGIAADTVEICPPCGSKWLCQGKAG